jgi:hypothetical protein
MTWLLCPLEKNPQNPLDRRLGGPQSHPGHYEEEKNLTLPKFEPQPVALLLYQLSYPSSHKRTSNIIIYYNYIHMHL